jgi:hypothetical protein
MIFRQLSKAILPTLEKDLSSSLSKQLSAMDDLMLIAPRVFSYQNSQTAGSTAATAGAFGRTALRQQQQKGSTMKKRSFVRVEKPVQRKGLFCD